MKQNNIKIHRAWERGNNKIAYLHRDKVTGKKKISETKFDWWFYVLTSAYNNNKRVFNKHLDNKNIKRIEPEGKYTRIYVDRCHNSDFLDINMEYCWEFKDWGLNSLSNDLDMLGIQTYEKDILPHKRWLLQSNVQIESDYKVLYYDIETYDESGKIVVGAERILSFAVLDEETGVSKFFCIREDTDDEEKRILLILAKLINRYDVLVSWNGKTFDDPYIKARFMRYGIVLDWRKILCQDHLKVFQVYGQKLTSYTLDNVGFEICGERKVEHLEGIYQMWKNNRKLLKEYNLQDVKLMYKIEKATKYLAVARDVNVIGKCTVDDIYITRKIDNMMVMSAQERKHYHFKTKVRNDDDPEKFKGAVVFKPKAGLYEDVKVLDFSSLYPNGIKTCNISPDTLITPENEAEIPDDKIITVCTGTKFRKDFIGILPELIMSMKDKRDYYKGLMAKCVPNTVEHKTYDRLQYVYKSFGLSFYGAIGETHSRFYNVEVAEAVTQTGVYFNKLCAKFIEKKGCNVIYGDSVTAERCTTIKIDGEIKIVSFEELFEMTDYKTENRGKEFGMFNDDVLGLTYSFKTKKSEWKPIKIVIRHKTDKQIYGYKTRNGATRITADHSLIDSNGKCFKPTERFDTFNIDSIPNESLKVVDLWKYVKPYTLKRKRGIDINLVADNDYIYMNYNTKMPLVKIKRYYKTELEIKQLLKIIAHYICNCYTSTMETCTRYASGICSNDKNLLQELKVIADNIFINGTHNIKHSTKDTYKLQMCTVFHAILWKQLAGQTCWFKSIPDFVYNLPLQYKDYFIDELMKGDGTIYNIDAGKKIEFETGSVNVASGIRYLADELGYVCAIRWNVDNNTYTIRSYLKEKCGKHLSKDIVKPIDYNGYVYDLSMEDNHNFVDTMGNVLLHNTDSSFIHGLKDKMVDPIIAKLTILCRNHAIKKFNCDECTMVMDYDKGFRKILMQDVKKRYAGYISYLDGHKLDEEKMYVAGLEYKRTDNCQYVRDKQFELIELLLQPKTPKITELITWLLECKEDIFRHRVKAEDMMFSVRLTKEIEEYTGRRLNCIVAEQMIEDGKEVWVGDKILYFIESVNEKQQPNPVPAYKWKGKYNEMYYWNKKIYPPLMRVLTTAYPNYDWNLYIMSGTKMNQKMAKMALW